ncbi:MarR family winged helix-turn-helix transcriptional regulator [Cellulomonas soli]|uniref:MarR family winged helix-turn-helix transcriptional regulator n=1 Tax=Cellulomonas soli TaxID=931535 RepID=UPI0015C87B2A|nr:MarR family transcriptional regulator [Cellulomonas soli]NYI60547.1 DNA-binding MarR family transcriptional regulator [Cellulomonas soli]
MHSDAPLGAPERVRHLTSWRLGLVNRRAHDLVAARLGAEGVTGRQYRLLAALAEAGPSSQAQLADRAGLDRADVVDAVTALLRRELLDRAGDPTDRRRNVITSTDAGLTLLARLDAEVAEAQRDLLAPLDEGERGQLDHLLDRLLLRHGDDLTED